MKFNKPKFWDKKNSFLSKFLLPFSFLVIFFIFLKKLIIKSKTFNIPIVCVGNIYLGGTGKTPLSILLANELNKKGKKTAIVRKYYSSHEDEYFLIKKYFKDLILDKKRESGIKIAEKNDFDIVILDDGFQDYKIKKNLNIICFNQRQLIGNGLVLPAGPLRENLNSLSKADLIMINGRKDKDFENQILKKNENIKFFYSQYRALNADTFKGKDLIAVAGIGNPENFFETLKNHNLKVVEEKIFPDHHKFKKIEISNIIQSAIKKGCEVIVTEKDYNKIKDFKFPNLNFLKIELVIDKKDELIEIINL